MLGSTAQYMKEGVSHVQMTAYARKFKLTKQMDLVKAVRRAVELHADRSSRLDQTVLAAAKVIAERGVLRSIPIVIPDNMYHDIII